MDGWKSIAACLWVSLHSDLYLMTEKHALLGLNQVTDLATEEYPISVP